MTTPIHEPAYTGRLAPAPTGALHLGNARTFLIAWLRARKAGGRLILRMEDLDHPKVKSGAAGEAYRDLRWLGLDWDAGPAGSFPPFAATPPGDAYVQSQRRDVYAALLRELEEKGLVYPCVCTRRDLESFQSAPNAGEDTRESRYPGLCRGRFASMDEARAAAAGREPGLRFVIGDDDVCFDDGFAGRRCGRPGQWSGDFLIGRGDGAGYQLAVVADDHLMGVTEVVRGDDLLASTERQILLYRALGWEPPAFYHVPLVVGADGRRLAKRHGDTRLSVLRTRGLGPERVLGWLAWSCGWVEKPCEMGMDAVWESADFSRMPHEAVTLEEGDKEWMGF